MSARIERVAWGGWPNCYRLSNGDVELIATSDVGPRILHYAYAGGPNLLLELRDQFGASGEREFRPRGGHRLWTAPEVFPRTYEADNAAVEAQVQASILTLTAPVESCGVRKQMRIRLAHVGPAVQVVHRIENALAWPISVSAWALTMMAPGGVGITAFPPRVTHPEVLPPTHPLVMWAFSDLSDPRWTFTRKYMILRQDPAIPEPTKLGHFNEKTWGAYLLGSHVFIKRYDAIPGAPYPDFGACYETFANGTTLELETLGPLTSLEPGAALEHTESWSLHRDVSLGSFTDKAIDEAILPLV